MKLLIELRLLNKIKKKLFLFTNPCAWWKFLKLQFNSKKNRKTKKEQKEILKRFKKAWNFEWASLAKTSF